MVEKEMDAAQIKKNMMSEIGNKILFDNKLQKEKITTPTIKNSWIKQDETGKKPENNALLINNNNKIEYDSKKEIITLTPALIQDPEYDKDRYKIVKVKVDIKNKTGTIITLDKKTNKEITKTYHLNDKDERNAFFDVLSSAGLLNDFQKMLERIQRDKSQTNGSWIQEDQILKSLQVYDMQNRLQSQTQDGVAAAVTKEKEIVKDAKTEA